MTAALLPMKPSARKVLGLLRTHDRVTTSQMLSAGTRYGARIGELRVLGFVISEQRIAAHASEYRLLRDPEREQILTARKAAQLERLRAEGEPLSLFDGGEMAA